MECLLTLPSAGGGLQYELPKPILQLIKEGYIVPK